MYFRGNLKNFKNAVVLFSKNAVISFSKDTPSTCFERLLWVF